MIAIYQGKEFVEGSASVLIGDARAHIFIAIEAKDRNGKPVILLNDEFPTWENRQDAAKLMLKHMNLVKAFNGTDDGDIHYDSPKTEETVMHILHNNK